MSRPALRANHGFTLIEVMVAALVIVLAFTALATIFVSGQSQASADVQQSQLINIADQELEQVRAAVATEGFDALGMSTTPAQLSTRVVRSTFFDPDSFIVTPSSTSCFLIANNYDSVTTGAATATPAYGISPPSGLVQWSTCGSNTTNTDSEPLQVLTGTSPNPIVTWSSASVPQCATGTGGGVSVPCWTPLSAGCTSTATTITTVPSCAVTVYAFVTDTFVGCGTSGGVGCPSTNANGVLQCASTSLPTSTSASTTCGDARRVIIAVVPNPPNQGNPNPSHELARVTPVYLSTVFTDPNPAGSSSSSTGLALNLSVQ
jgi:prepilin-type N-terminal cleavage/methylation domain-containing protein